jgi:hypothetical protein
MSKFLLIQDNAISPEMLKLAKNTLYRGSIWSLSGESYNGDPNITLAAWTYIHEINALLDQGEFNKANVVFNLWEAIKSPIEKRFNNVVKRVYNGSLPLYDQTMHIDEDENVRGTQNVTAVCFLNTVWKKEWGGELLLYNEDGSRVTDGTFPVPGRMVVFRPEANHRGVMPSRCAQEMRFSIAFQCRYKV